MPRIERIINIDYMVAAEMSRASVARVCRRNVRFEFVAIDRRIIGIAAPT